MIEQIIKRDGRLEPFSADKINGWGEWASKSLGSHFDWSSVVMKTVASLPTVCSSAELQSALIRHCLNQNSWSYNRMAGRLYATTIYKDLYNGKIPTVKEVHRRLAEVGYMAVLPYSDEEYAEVEKFIKHKRDFRYAHFQLHHVRYKYALRDRLSKAEYESPQFVYMRMAMALAADQPLDRRLTDVRKWYDFFSRNIINAPTPNYVNLGTHLNGYASCCLYTTKDTAPSLAAGDHIAYMMTVMSAGIGNNLQCRSIGDAVRGGLIKHMGKLPYYRAMVGAVRANMQNGRAGACTTYYSAYDPEVETLMRLKNPMTPADRQIRGMDYNQISNKFLARKAARKENIFLFNCHTAPDLHRAFYSGDQENFERLYAKYEADESFAKTYVSARDIVLTSLNEAYETGRAYHIAIDEVNRHTPYKDVIYSSNLCVEIVEPTEGFESVQDLYSGHSVGYIRFNTDKNSAKLNATGFRINAPDPVAMVSGSSRLKAAQELEVGDRFMHLGEEHEVTEITELKREPEVALCSLAGLVVSNIESDDEYAEAMYYSLLMIDKCIHKSEYVLPHIGYTAKQRLAAGVGMMDLAHYMAKRKLKYSSQEGKEEIHRVAERHMYWAIEASLRLGQELGNAPWMHRTKWVDGWLPIDTYNRKIDEVVQVPLQYNWEDLRTRVIDNGGIRNSVLVAYMPGESSSKASGTVNSIYPARDLTMMKTDNDITTYWAAPEGDKLGKYYELSWDIPTSDMIHVYAIFQKFTDQTISADFWRRIEGDEKVTSTEMLNIYFDMHKYGMKTRYYQNTKTAKPVVLGEEPLDVRLTREEVQALEFLTVDDLIESEMINDNKDGTFQVSINLIDTIRAMKEEGAGAGCAGGGCTL